MSQVFISYSSGDRNWAETLEDKLCRAGIEVYRDKSRLTVANPFKEQLQGALRMSSALLTLWSERVRNEQGQWKEWVISEREYFRAQHLWVR